MAELGDALGEDEPVFELPVGEAVAVRFGQVAGGVHPGRPIEGTPDVIADAADPFLVDHRADVVDQDRLDPARFGCPEQHRQEAAQ